MMTGIGSQSSALRFRESIARQVRQEIQLAVGTPRYATVTQVNPDFGNCRVRFRDETNDVLVRMGAIQPSEVGQVVRVSGPSSDLWVIDVIGRAALTGAPSSFLAAPTNLSLFGIGPGFTASWFPVSLADKYELQVADDAGFTINNRSFVTVSTRFTLDELVIGATHYARVRAVSSSGQVGPFSTVKSIVVPGFPIPSPTDGTRPASSPTAICSSGIGFLIVEWLPVTNNDLVTYEIYADLESGFTPSAGNKLGETTGTFYTFRRLTDSTQLPYTNNTFVRIIARDGDGAAPAGPQGFAKPDQINSADFGNVTDSVISDGIAPTASPTSFTVTAGIGYLFLTWSPIVNDDQTTYEIHLGTSPLFTPTANTLTAETIGTFFFVRKRPPGFGGGALTYEQTYHIKLWAKDRDGYAPGPSPSQTGTSVKTASDDIGDGAVGTLQIADAAIVTAKIAELAVGEAQIQSASITTAKIQNAAITNAKIQNASIDSAKIADASIGTAKIANAAITDAKIASLNADKINAGTITSINITGGTITGANLQTATTGQRIVINGGGASGFIYYYSGNGSELFPGFVRAGYGNNPFGNPAGFLTIASPKVSTSGANSGALLEMWQQQSDGSQLSKITGDFILDGTLYSSADSLVVKMASSGLTRFQVQPTDSSLFFSTGNREMHWQDDGNVVIYESTTALWNSGTTISDRRHKKNITAADIDAMAAIREMPLRSFEFKNPSIAVGRQYGVIAQDVEAAFGQGVTKIGDDLLLNVPALVALLIGGVNSLCDRIEAVEARMAAVEAQ